MAERASCRMLMVEKIVEEEVVVVVVMMVVEMAAPSNYTRVKVESEGEGRCD